MLSTGSRNFHRCCILLDAIAFTLVYLRFIKILYLPLYLYYRLLTVLIRVKKMLHGHGCTHTILVLL